MNSKKINDYILANHRSVYQYCKVVEINRATISRYLSEERVPEYPIAKKIVHESKGFITYQDIYGKDKYLCKG